MNDFASFTLARYEQLCKDVLDRYTVLAFGDAPTERSVLWRHDVDISVDQALRFARMEHGLGLRSTYFFLPHSISYNLWAEETATAARQIVALGHRAALHFDPKFYDRRLDLSELELLAGREREWLERLLDCEVEAISFHHAGDLVDGPPAGERVAGMVNAYSATIREQFHYVSDSNGLWRFDNLFDVVANDAYDHLHVLTHPVWWSDEALPPRRRLQQCIDAAAAAFGQSWDDISAHYGRPNIDWPEPGDDVAHGRI